MNTLTLYELTEQYQGIEAAIIEAGGEITPDIQILLDSTKEALDEKLASYNKMIRRFEGSEAAIDNEIKRLQAMKRTAQNAQKGLKNHLLFAMNAMGLQRLDSELCKAYIRTSHATEIDTEVFMQPYNHLAEELEAKYPFIRVKIEPNKQAIADRYKGEDIAPAGVTFVDNQNLIIK